MKKCNIMINNTSKPTKNIPFHINITSDFKTLRKSMCNRVYSCVTDNLLLYDRRFGFKNSCSIAYITLEIF